MKFFKIFFEDTFRQDKIDYVEADNDTDAITILINKKKKQSISTINDVIESTFREAEGHYSSLRKHHKWNEHLKTLNKTK